MIEAIDKGLNPYKKLFKREITRDDIVRLTEIKIKRISKYDSFRADEEIKGLEDAIAETDEEPEESHPLRGSLLPKPQEEVWGGAGGRAPRSPSSSGSTAPRWWLPPRPSIVDEKNGFAGWGLKRRTLDREVFPAR